MFLQSVVGSRTSLPSASHVTFHTRLSRHSYMALAMPPVIYRTELSRGGVEQCFLSGWHLLYRTDIIYRVRSLMHHHAIIHGISFRGFNPLKSNDPYMGHNAPLTSRRCILYIYSTNIRTEYFKHAAHSPFFLSSKCRLCHNATLFGSCIIRILHTVCVKI